VTESAVSAEYSALVGSSLRELGNTMVRGERPNIENLLGWEYRGTNIPAVSTLLGLRRFIKGFVLDAQKKPVGYNKKVIGPDLRTPWSEAPQRDGRIAFAYFAMAPVDPEATDNRYLNALLLDYGAVAEPEHGMAGHLRDYLVRARPDSDDLLLGHAFLAIGRRRVPLSWFALERMGTAVEGTTPGQAAEP
jgi:hypothetical protein